MNEALEIFYYTLGKFWQFIFGAYIFEGVSIGMIFVVCTIFTILMYYAMAVPKIKVGGTPKHEGDTYYGRSNEKGDIFMYKRNR